MSHYVTLSLGRVYCNEMLGPSHKWSDQIKYDDKNGPTRTIYIVICGPLNSPVHKSRPNNKICSYHSTVCISTFEVYFFRYRARLRKYLYYFTSNIAVGCTGKCRLNVSSRFIGKARFSVSSRLHWAIKLGLGTVSTLEPHWP